MLTSIARLLKGLYLDAQMAFDSGLRKKHVCLRFRAYAIEVNLQHRQGYLQALQHCRCFYVGSFVYPSAKTIAEEFVEGACITTYL